METKIPKFVEDPGNGSEMRYPILRLLSEQELSELLQCQPGEVLARLIRSNCGKRHGRNLDVLQLTHALLALRADLNAKG
ncbi:MAG: hypothetical protein KDB88_11805 [Flavobacteriales bacterium]|nr:hypothetical protein [Flavobacteriales bacterium]